MRIWLVKSSMTFSCTFTVDKHEACLINKIINKDCVLIILFDFKNHSFFEEADLVKIVDRFMDTIVVLPFNIGKRMKDE